MTDNTKKINIDKEQNPNDLRFEIQKKKRNS